ncbi:MAG: Gfo/Idh/MocA family oxidoreductase [Candidatus Omnitrophica bacterium]|nr:Gfo/Idh/MocA family oxidoreductase [Candidatus Omnitrophota bacterium]
MRKYRAAIVGCGRIGSLFNKDKLREGIVTHAAAYKDNPDVELVAACDIDEERLEDFGALWEVDSLYMNFEEMLRNEEIDILSICTWGSTHFELVSKAAEFGIKAIFCEKPISNNLSEADEMVELCERKGIVLAVNHSRRWDAFEREIKDYMLSGKLGHIRNVSAYYTAGIMNTGTHLLDLLRFFFGEAKWVWTNPEIRGDSQDPTLDGCIFFKQGFSCFLQGLDVSDYAIFEIDIYGEKGRIRIKNSGFDLKFWMSEDSPRFSGYKELAEKEPFVKNGYKDVLKNAVKDIVSCIENRKSSLSSGNDGKKALEIICALHESIDRKGERVFLPLNKRDTTIKTK